uniref:Trithorax n=1 Tax=Solanum tuberosum TaxID=4113 RepID=M1BJL3_SOLTU
MAVKRKTNKKEIDDEIYRENWFFTSKKQKFDEVFRAGFKDFSFQVKVEESKLPNFLPQVQDYCFSAESPRSHLHREVKVELRKINICCSAGKKVCSDLNGNSLCPDCGVKSNFIAVICNGMEGIYFPELHMVECRCGSCRVKKLTVGEWERHAGSRAKKWKIAVHQECYGAREVQDLASWVCRACETPEVERECCLCPVKGGALKPTEVDPFWVHVTCGWFRPEIAFVDYEKMEPAIGLLVIPPKSFHQACSICQQTHGSCIQCSKCTISYHSTCASRAGYYMEMQCSEKNGTQTTKWLSYCASHKAPSEDNILVMRTSGGVYSNQNLLQRRNGGRVLKGLRLMPSDASSAETNEPDDFSAARCRVFRPSTDKKAKPEPIIHRVTRPHHHSLTAIQSLTSKQHQEEKNFPTLRERLHHLSITINHRVCFGKSGIHGWGLFAKRKLQEGEMVAEYVGEKIRGSVADLRERKYKSQGKNCYFFRINEEVVIDATMKGSIARLINHSCMPNCFSRIMSLGKNEDRIVLFAKKDVSAGNELTFDYRFEPDQNDEVKVPCHCGAPNCSKFMN